jgi:hypothetical protein
MDLGPGGLSSPGPSGFGGGYNATGTDYNASGGSNEPVMFPEQLNLPGPEAPKLAQTIQRAVDSPFGRGAEFAFKTALSSAFPAYGLITLAQDIYNAGGVSPYFQQQKETLQNLLNQPTITAPPVVTTGGDNQPIIPRIPMVTETPTDVDGTLSDLDMYIQNLRAQTPTPFALDPRFAAAEGGVARQAYGLGSLVRKATKGIKKILKSDVGKAALAAGAVYGLGGGTFFGKSIPGLAKAGGFKFGNIMPNLFGVGAAGDYDKGARGILGTLRLTPGYGTREMTGFGKLAALAGPSILAGLSTAGEEDESLDGISDRTDTSGLKELIASYPALRFQVRPEYQLAAKGGRIGYEDAGMVNPDELPMSKEGSPMFTDTETGEEVGYPYNEEMSSAPNIDAELYQMYLDAIGSGQIPRATTFDQYKELMSDRMGAKEGGLMDLGGMEKDYRAEGGFVPIGKEEKADDVPARLSKNEFVFTADAVRSAGDGDIDKGAEVMYNVMKNLESGGKISDESQGLQGARDMFQTSKRLGEIL